MKILIKNGNTVTAKGIKKADILINNGIIEKIASKIDVKVDQEIDAKNKCVIPGLIDLHVHFRTPGREDKEDLISGSKAAAKGGFTTVFCMPNTEPCLDTQGSIKWIRDESDKIGVVDIFPVGAITQKREGKKLTEMGAMQEAGCFAVSDDGSSVEDSALFRRALEYAKMFNLVVIAHCEDSSLSSGGAVRESFISSKYGISSVPDIAESIRVARDISLAIYAKSRLHIAHVSSKKSLEIIKQAKKETDLITCETAPHYLSFTVDDVEKNNFDSKFKVNPPLGEKKDKEALYKAIQDGTIDCIATDHAPHTVAEKENSFEKAPFGMIGLEMAFSSMYTNLVEKGIISLEKLVELLSTNPAKCMGMKDRGKIEEKLKADIAIVDLEKSWQVKEENIVSKSKNTPFMGQTLKAVTVLTIQNGKVVYNSNK